MVVIVNHGASQEVEASTEQKLSASRSTSLQAISDTYDALSEWNEAVKADAEGDVDGAVDRYEAAIDKARNARASWKQAEHAQSEVIRHVLSLDSELTVRDEVVEQVAEIDAQEHIDELQADGFLADVDTDVDSVAEFGAQLGFEGEGSIDTGDRAEGWNALAELYRMDLRGRMQCKNEVDSFAAALEDAKWQAEEGRLFESYQRSTHRGEGRYPVAQASGEVQGQLQSYELFRTAAGMLNTRATEQAEDDMWAEVEEYGALDTTEQKADAEQERPRQRP